MNTRITLSALLVSILLATPALAAKDNTGIVDQYASKNSTGIVDQYASKNSTGIVDQYASKNSTGIVDQYASNDSDGPLRGAWWEQSQLS